MELIIGGIYQGKTEYAKNKYGLKKDDIFNCSDKNEIDFSKRCIAGTEDFVLSCIRDGKDSLSFFKEHETEWQDSVIIMRDIFCGVVPVDPEMRLWRDECGRLLTYLSKNADTVIRMFCGIPHTIKQ